MTEPVAISFAAVDYDALSEAPGRIAVLVEAEGRMNVAARRLDVMSRKAVSRLVASPAWSKSKVGEATLLAFPAGLAADGLVVVKVPRKPSAAEARRAGAAIAKFRGTGPLTVAAARFPLVEELVVALTLRAYEFVDHKTALRETPGTMTVLVEDPDGVKSRIQPFNAVAKGVFFTRDLVNEPANLLTTTEFARRLEGLRDLGVEVEVLEEADLERIGMRLLLAVGQGSASPSKVVVMQWKGGGAEKPFAFVGKGVVFDTGGISIKPGGGMEDMKGDMAGAAAVVGLMHALASRKAKANVIGAIGLTENMPDGDAQRPGDIIKTLSGQTV